jgi:hypothetical protein
MPSRLELHAELIKFLPNAYFQPPANIRMTYPCIVYNKTGKSRDFANDGVYRRQQEYQLMVIEHDPDSSVADSIEDSLQYCVISQNYTVDNLHHTTLNLYY